jgi:3-polyprenyl-4-hydroxybenzoate decarboxylase
LDGQAIDDPAPIPSESACKETIAWVRSCEGVLEATTPEAAPGWVFIRVDRGYDEADRAGLGGKVLDEFWNEPTAHRFVVVVGRDVDIHDHHEVLFHWVANCDFARDAQWDQSHGCDRVGFDATPKTYGDARNNQPVRAWPPILSMNDVVKSRCDQVRLSR